MAKRAGHLNEETQYVMDKLGVQPPEYMKDVRPQVRDIQIRKTPGVSKEISVKTAWTLMKEQNVVTLPVTKENVLEGLITIGDIAKSYFQVYDSTILQQPRHGIRILWIHWKERLLQGKQTVFLKKEKL